MSPGLRHASHLLLALTVILAAPAALFLFAWFHLPPEEQNALIEILDRHPGLLVTAAAVFVAALLFAVAWIYRFYVAPLESIIEEIELISRTNASYRLTGAGSVGLHRLSGGVNALASRIDELQRSTEERIRDANATIEREKNTLALLIQGLADGVIVTTTNGQILLANTRARTLAPGQGEDTAPMGLGRSVFGYLDRDPVAHAMNEIARRIREHRDERSTTFMTSGVGGVLLHVTMSPVISENVVQGYIMSLDDVTQRTSRETERDRTFLSLSSAVRHSITTIRGAVETIREYGAMKEPQRSRLTGVIHDEVLALTELLESSVTEHQRHSASLRSHDDLRVSDLLVSVAARTEQTLDVQARLESTERPFAMQIDAFSIIQSLVFVTERIKQITGALAYTFRAERLERFVAIEIIWAGAPLPAATVRGWESETVRVAGLSLMESLSSILQRHNAEIWSQAGSTQGTAMVRVLLPLAASEEIAADATGGPGDQPDAADPAGQLYEFDFFANREPSPEEESPLEDLTYTVFDTETTGLQPTAGDEIIALGAVRIVKGKIVRGEAFDRLVDPGRKLTSHSTAIHGITGDMLHGQPPLAEVLPLFRSFCNGSILVAHNAAFDMRFLQMKEASTGIRFPMPVLDTLLLSTIVHPNQADHRLETLVARLGTSNAGRHTALGDAMMTAEVFLKLIPLLKLRNIHTLREAIEASQKSYYARLHY